MQYTTQENYKCKINKLEALQYPGTREIQSKNDSMLNVEQLKIKIRELFALSKKCHALF
jgi:hypothetical protein